MTVSGGRPLPHRPGHTPRACFARTRPFRRGRKGQWIPAFAGMTCCVRRTVMGVVLVLVDMLGLASPLASEMLDCRRFSTGHCPRRQSAGPLDGDLHRPESGSFAHPRAVAAAPQRLGPDVCRIHDRLSGPLQGVCRAPRSGSPPERGRGESCGARLTCTVRQSLRTVRTPCWLVLPGRH